MVYMNNRPGLFFKALPSERLFTSTARIVPKDRRLTPQGSWTELSRPRVLAAGPPADAFAPAMPPPAHETMLAEAARRFQAGERPMTFASQPQSGLDGATATKPAQGPSFATLSHCSATATPRGSAAPTPLPASTQRPDDTVQQPTPDDIPAAVPPTPDGQFFYFDTNNKWRRPVHIERGGSKLYAYRCGVGEPEPVRGRDYIRPAQARDDCQYPDPTEEIQRLREKSIERLAAREERERARRRVCHEETEDAEIEQRIRAEYFAKELMGTKLEAKTMHREPAPATPPLDQNGTWQAFRSPRKTAFPHPPQEYILKDYQLRDVIHRVYDGLADNYPIQNMSLFHTTAFCPTDRPLAKPTAARSAAMLRLRREASKPPPPAGRRNLNSKGFLGSFSHDFCPNWTGEDSQGNKVSAPLDATFSTWRANGKEKIEPTSLFLLPVKDYGGKHHPSVHEEDITVYQPPTDTNGARKTLRFRNVDILDSNINLQTVRPDLFRDTAVEAQNPFLSGGVVYPDGPDGTTTCKMCF